MIGRPYHPTPPPASVPREVARAGSAVFLLGLLVLIAVALVS